MKTCKNTLKKEIKKLRESIYLKCLYCVNCHVKEVIECETKECPLWKIRPTKARGLYTLIKRLRKTKLSISEVNI